MPLFCKHANETSTVKFITTHHDNLCSANLRLINNHIMLSCMMWNTALRHASIFKCPKLRIYAYLVTWCIVAWKKMRIFMWWAFHLKFTQKSIWCTLALTPRYDDRVFCICSMCK